ncbi:MAG: hypothetical protein KDC57_15870 [Saprospiraceae bacterium]|nr:hypothetical protein [Saprospiraceae bacterium]
MKYLLGFVGLIGLMMMPDRMQGQSIFEQWPALDDFHEVMSQTFHPAEEGNLEPIKSRSGEMITKAKMLAKSDVPAAFANPAITMATKKLVKGSKSLHKLVKKGNDEAITTSLVGLHDVFHEIVGLCRGDDH